MVESILIVFESVHQFAKETGMSLKEIERTGHALDYPIGFKKRCI